MYCQLYAWRYVALPVALFRVALDEFQWKGLLVHVIRNIGVCMAHMSLWMYVHALGIVVVAELAKRDPIIIVVRFIDP